jgi:6-phosphogluconolactonase
VYVGTYTNRDKSKGIYAYQLDEATGMLSPLGLAAETPNPSYLQIHPTGRFLYAANELGNYKGERSGSLTAFAVNPATGMLTELNQIASKGGAPCHMTIDKSGKTLVNANYSGGNVISVALAADGRLGEIISNVQHQGSGPNAQRQRQAHAHSFNISPDNRYAVAADLGTDQVLVYRLDATTGTISPNEPPFTKVSPGSGPRHFAFHPNARYAYVINELMSTVTAFSWAAAKGTLTEIQTVSTLPAGWTGVNHTAEVVVHPSGKFLYGSNRGHDSLAVFSVDAQKGTLTLVDHTPTQGKIPRNFNIDPSGRWLIAANQNSDNLVVFRIDEKTGKLTPTGQVLEVGAPVCVKFLRMKR